MQALTVNCGSSSVKLAVVDVEQEHVVAKEFVQSLRQEDSVTGYKEAINAGLDLLAEELGYALEPTFVAHRVVHGGTKYADPIKLTNEIITDLEGLIPLAPLHNPHNIAGIQAAQNQFNDIPHFAVFDTGFHQTIPEISRIYALPKKLTVAHNLYRYGFHGINQAHIARQLTEERGNQKFNAISCHLGSGCSITAMINGKSVGCSMGFTPISGVPMATRAGDVDAGIIFYLLRNTSLSAEAIENILLKESGWYGLSEIDPDLRKVVERLNTDGSAQVALDYFVQRVAKEVMSMTALLDGNCDYLVFTAGVGEGSQLIRDLITAKLWALEDRGMKIRVIPANEELEMVLQIKSSM